ncbi:hypothetical protein AAG570_012319 [Ranatra chinensis]|uniref:Titin n=1 Tax=Ranatra chinensis TaxID=642074 RepID=A0ABD0YUT3_9HEMI
MKYQFRVTAESSAGISEPSPLSEIIAISHQRTFASVPCFVRALQDTVAIENEKVEFIVQVEGTPAPKLVWYKDGFEVYSSRRQRIITENDTSSLVIHQAAFTDEGEIKCTATNKAGHIVTKSRLRIEASPTIRLPRQYEDGLLFELGETVRLKISVTGRPQPQVYWFHDGEIIVSGGRQEITTTERYTTLKVSEATRQDRGEYQVKAANRLGEDVVSFLVTITDRPLPPGTAQVVMTLGRCVTLSWSAPSDDGGCKIGNYIVEYYRVGWNMWLKAATCRQLTTTLGDLIEGSEYKFRVKAENPYGISDPSDESDIIFIPDPKRGLTFSMLEPPARDGTLLLNEELSEEWLEARKKHNELLDNSPMVKQYGNENKFEDKKGYDWEEERPIPSPVMLANQVLRKVKMAPKRGWSDDSQTSPPTSPERPIPPQRKSRLKNIKAIEGQHYSKNMRENSPEDFPKIEYHSTGKMKRVEESLHSSSELMLVLLPSGRADTEERAEWRDTVESLKHPKTLIAPPISLSAPELGSCEPFDSSLIRNSVSSTELLHVRAIARFYQDTAEDEREELKKNYGIERRHSFENRAPKSRTEVSIRKCESPATENTQEICTRALINNEEGKGDHLLKSNTSRFMDDNMYYIDDNYPGRLIGSEKEFGELEMIQNELGDFSQEREGASEEISNYSPTRTENDFIDYFEEDTYHPNMIPKSEIVLIESINSATEISSENTEENTSKTSITNVERQNVNADLESHHDTKLLINSSSYMSEMPSLTSQSNYLLSQPLKPILKVRDNLQGKKVKNRLFSYMLTDKISEIPTALVHENVNEENKTKKKVRIEEPEEKYVEQLVGEDDRDVLMTGEVARNRRKQIRQNLPGEETDPTNIIISHYSDIVREFGYGKKPKAKLYLDYEDLKAAADKVETEFLDKSGINTEIMKASSYSEYPISNITIDHSIQNAPEIICENINPVEIINYNQPEEMVKIPKSSVGFLLDLSLFLVACWLYMFNDERLAIPVLFLMIYRQIHEMIENKMKKWKKTT